MGAKQPILFAGKAIGAGIDAGRDRACNGGGRTLRRCRDRFGERQLARGRAAERNMQIHGSMLRRFGAPASCPWRQDEQALIRRLALQFPLQEGQPPPVTQSDRAVIDPIPASRNHAMPHYTDPRAPLRLTAGSLRQRPLLGYGLAVTSAALALVIRLAIG